jgi:hypothetical protein
MRALLLVLLAAPALPALPLCEGAQCARSLVQPVPSILKLQTRVSQARFPDGRAEFRRLKVVLRGTSGSQCSETFEQVVVEGGVLNLEIGRNIEGCVLTDLIATEPALTFQLCMAGQESCMSPVELPTAPYAVKSNLAQKAETAYTADIAAKAVYALRFTADRDLQTADALGAGYFDAWAPAPKNPGVKALLENTAWEPYAFDGYLQWAPVSRDRNDPTGLILCGMDATSGDARSLSELTFQSGQTVALGDMTGLGLSIQDAMLVNGAGSGHHALFSDAAPELAAATGDNVFHTGTRIGAAHLEVHGSAELAEVAVAGDLDVRDELLVSGGALLQHGTEQSLQVNGAYVRARAGDSSLQIDGTEIRVVGPLTIQRQSDKTGAPADIASGSELRGATTISGILLEVKDAAVLRNKARFEELDIGASSTTFADRLRIAAIAGAPSSLAVWATSLLEGSSTIEVLKGEGGVSVDALQVTGTMTASPISHSTDGTATFAGSPTFAGKVSLQGKAEVAFAMDDVPDGAVTATELHLEQNSPCLEAALMGLRSEGSRVCLQQPTLEGEGAGVKVGTALAQASLAVGSRQAQIGTVGANLALSAGNLQLTLDGNKVTVNTAVRVDNDLQADLRLECKTESSPVTKVQYMASNDAVSNGTKVSQSCGTGTVIMGASSRWSTPRADRPTECGGPFAPELAHQVAKVCTYDPNGYSCTAYEYTKLSQVCLTVEVECCRVE